MLPQGYMGSFKKYQQISNFEKIEFLAFVTSGVFKGSLKKCQLIRSSRLASYSWHIYEQI